MLRCAGALLVAAVAATASVPRAAHAQKLDPYRIDGKFVTLFFQETGDLIRRVDDQWRGALFSPTGSGKQEMLANSPFFQREAWVLDLGGQLVRSYFAPDYLPGEVATPSTEGSIAGEVEVRTFQWELQDPSFGRVALTQRVTLPNDAKRVRFDILIRNLNDETLNGVRYLRTVNPMQGANPELPPEFVRFGTKNQLGTDVFPEGIAASALIPDVPDAFQRVLAIASEEPWTRVNAFGDANTNAQIDEIGKAYYELPPLDPANPGAGVGDPVFGGSGNAFLFDLSRPVALNLWFGGDDGYSLGPGDELKLGTFFYVFEGPSGGEPIPEPGPLALLLGAGTAGAAGAALRGRRPKGPPG